MNSSRNMHQRRTFLRSTGLRVHGLSGLLLLACLLTARAQEQQQGLCAEIKMEIDQQLTLERIGFLATLTLTDNDSTDPITDFAANLTFENHLLSTNGVNDSSSLFFVQPPTLQNINDISGAGVVGPSQTATISWFIIPTVNAGGTSPGGVRYQVGATAERQDSRGVHSRGDVAGLSGPHHRRSPTPSSKSLTSSRVMSWATIPSRPVWEPHPIHLRRPGPERRLWPGQQRGDRSRSSPRSWRTSRTC